MGSQVPSPTHVHESQLLTLKAPLKYGLYSLKSDLDYSMQKVYTRVASGNLLDPTLNTSPKSHHGGIYVILRTSNLGPHVTLKGQDCTDGPRVTWDLEPVWTGPKKLDGAWITKVGFCFPTIQIIFTESPLHLHGHSSLGIIILPMAWQCYKPLLFTRTKEHPSKSHTDQHKK